MVVLGALAGYLLFGAAGAVGVGAVLVNLFTPLPAAALGMRIGPLWGAAAVGLTAVAVVAHEIPQEVGDFIVLVNAGLSRLRALAYNALSGLASVVGGMVGYLVVGPWKELFPFLLVVAASSFIYVAVADLLPQLQQRLSLRETATQIAWLGLGLGLVLTAKTLLHATAH